MSGWVENQTRRSSVFLILVLCIVACGAYYFLIFNRSQVEIVVEVDHPSIFKLYWASGENPFSEKNHAAVKISPGQTDYSFSFTDIGRVDRLRLDPIEHDGSVLVKSIIISQRGYEPTSLALDAATPLYDIAEYRVDQDGLHVEAGGNDPNFMVLPAIVKSRVSWPVEGFRYLLICLTVIFIVTACAPLQRDFAYVPVMLSMAFILVVSMAAVSKRNAHPDEYVHLFATTYYQDHWLPPDIENPEIEHTYSPYGISRLNNGEIYYLLSGKFSLLAQGLNIPPLLALRLLNVFMFGCIVLYAVGSVPARLVALPFLISPQVWYIFSYCGSDAFGLFLCFLAGCEIVRPNSFLNRIVGGDSRLGLVFSGGLIALILALLLLLKINYFPFVILLSIYVIWQVWRYGEPGSRRAALGRFLAVALLAALLAGLRMGADYYVNGIDRQDKMASMQEKTAHHWFKPSTELHKKHVTMYMKQRGTTLERLVTTHNWFEHTFVNGFGVYGYFTISAPDEYYELVKWAASIFLIYILAVVLIRGNSETRLLALLVLGLCVALLGASLYRSWTVDFQPQGRYLFPILPMFGVLLARSRALFSSTVFTVLLSTLFLLALYSFIFIGLVAIPRPA